MIVSKLSGKLFYTILLCLVAVGVSGQQISPAVTDAYLYQFSANGVFIDMSMGEVAVTTIKSPGQIITQGYLQPISIEQPCSSADLIYYPNPVISQITIEASNCDLRLGYVEVYDLFGKIVLIADASNNKIDLSTIGIGVYIIRAYTDNGQLIGNVKIIKTTV